MVSFLVGIHNIFSFIKNLALPNATSSSFDIESCCHHNDSFIKCVGPDHCVYKSSAAWQQNVSSVYLKSF